MRWFLILIKLIKKMKKSMVRITSSPVIPTYLRGRDQIDHSSRPTQAKSW
jgi:hypothetical protein